MEFIYAAWILFALISIFYFLLLLNFHDDIYSVDSLPKSPTAVVLGAGLEKNNKPSDILKDRLLTAIDLINSSYPDQIILSGAIAPGIGSETKAMTAFLLERIPVQGLIITDDSGKSTFDSLLNLLYKEAAQPVTVITQRFHLTRALLIGKILGIECNGLAANHYKFAWWKLFYWYIREIIATPFNICKIIFHKHFQYLKKS